MTGNPRAYAASQAAKKDDEQSVEAPGQAFHEAPGSSVKDGNSRQGLAPASPQRNLSMSESLIQAMHASGIPVESIPAPRPNYTNWKGTGKGRVPVVGLTKPKPDESPKELKSALRSLLREVAQPVAVVTSFMPHQKRHTLRLSAHTHEMPEHERFHGATLSSFSSIAMDPHPLVAFALRVPSRMAATLSSLVPSVLTTSPHPSKSKQRSASRPHHGGVTHLVLNVLSSSQDHLAHAFSRPDLHPHPFKTAPYTLSAGGLPVLDGALGALSCRVVGRVQLSELGWEGGQQDALGRKHPIDGVASELFIARVVKVEEVGVNRPVEIEKKDERSSSIPTPLLYWRRGYTSCGQS